MLLAGDLDLVIDANADTATSTTIGELTTLGNFAYYRYDDGVHGTELWRSDGTTAGTNMVKDIRPGDLWGNPLNLTAIGDTLYFTSHGQLWQSDGTAAGTVAAPALIHQLSGGNVENLIDAGGTTYIRDASAPDRFDLWKSDGTASGTTLLVSITNRENRPLNDEAPDRWVAIGSDLYFVPTSRDVAKELWKTNGTQTGTFRVGGSTWGKIAANISHLTRRGDELLFTAADTDSIIQYQSPIYTYEDHIWNTDGSPEFPRSIGFLGQNYASPQLTVMNDLVFYTRKGILYASPGESNDITEITHLSTASQLTPVNGTLFFHEFGLAFPRTGGELHASDGTIGGTHQVKDINPGPNGSTIQILGHAGGILYFTANNGEVTELWRSDGTETGTTPVRLAGDRSFRPSDEFAVVGNRVLFAGYALETGSPDDPPTVGRELYSLLWNDLATNAGDYDGSGLVDGTDFLAWQRQNGTIAFPPASGADGTANGVIDADDLTVWQTSYGSAADAITAGELVRDAALATESTPSDADLTALAIAVATPAVQQGAGDDLDARPVHRHATAPAVGLSTDLDLRRLAVRTALPTDDSLMGPLTASNNEKTAASAGRRPGQVAHDWGPSITTSLGI